MHNYHLLPLFSPCYQKTSCHYQEHSYPLVDVHRLVKKYYRPNHAEDIA